MSALYINQQTLDIEFREGKLRFTDDLTEAAVQGIRQRMQTWRGEWFLNTSVGVPYLTQVFAVKNPNPTLLEGMFREIILQVPEIDTVPFVQVLINAVTREATVNWKARLVDGTVITSEDYKPFLLGDLTRQ